MLSKSKIRKNFSRAAGSYDNFAFFQQRCREKILKEIYSFKQVPETILDIGCGTGRSIRQLTAVYPEATILGIDLAEGMVVCAKRENSNKARFCQAEAEHLPLPEKTFDLVISNLTYQWVENLSSAFREVYRVLKEEGRFYFTTLGEGSLKELYFSFAEAHRQFKIPSYTHGQDFLSLPELENIIKEAGFSVSAISSSMEINYYPKVENFLKRLKQIGANNAAAELGSKGINRKIIMEMLKIYDKKYRLNGNIPVSYEVIFGQGRK